MNDVLAHRALVPEATGPRLAVLEMALRKLFNFRQLPHEVVSSAVSARLRGRFGRKFTSRKGEEMSNFDIVLMTSRSEFPSDPGGNN